MRAQTGAVREVTRPGDVVLGSEELAHESPFRRSLSSRDPIVTIARSRWAVGRSGARVELEVETADAAQDVRRHVVVAAGADRAVLGLGDPDVVHPVEQSLDGDAALGPGERRARAGVDAAAEREVLAGVGALDVELGRVLEVARDRGWRRR